MDAQQRTRRVDRDKSAATSQGLPRGAKQMVIPMTREQDTEIWTDASKVRARLDEWLAEFPELFAANMSAGYALHGLGRESRKLPGVRLRKVKLADGAVYWLRPSFILGYMTGTVEPAMSSPTTPHRPSIPTAGPRPRTPSGPCFR
jgi:hypothetical protein